MSPFAAAPSLAVRILGQADDPRLTHSRRLARQRARARRAQRTT
jgi:hypothetical protein